MSKPCDSIRVEFVHITLKTVLVVPWQIIPEMVNRNTSLPQKMFFFPLCQVCSEVKLLASIHVMSGPLIVGLCVHTQLYYV